MSTANNATFDRDITGAFFVASCLKVFGGLEIVGTILAAALTGSASTGSTGLRIAITLYVIAGGLFVGVLVFAAAYALAMLAHIALGRGR